MKTCLSLLLISLCHIASAQEMTLSTLTLTPTAVGPGVGTFNAVSSPVYTSNGMFSPTQTGPALWGDPPSLTGPFQAGVAGEGLGVSCLSGCSGLPSWAGTTFLEASFATPVDSVSVTEYNNVENPTGFQALNSLGQVIGTCSWYLGNGATCYSPLSTGFVCVATCTTGGIFTLTDPDDISYILATSYDMSPSQLSDITYSVPLPDSFWLLLMGLISLLYKAWSSKVNYIRGL
jgi:hypothetical protein